jgi:Mn-dependent DtxR family transcriptional regulator
VNTTVQGLKPPVVRVLEAVIAYVDTNDLNPTVEYLAASLGKSLPTVQGYLTILESRGWIVRLGAGAGRLGQTIALTGKPWTRES